MEIVKWIDGLVRNIQQIHIIAVIGIPLLIGTIISAFRSGRKK